MILPVPIHFLHSLPFPTRASTWCNVSRPASFFEFLEKCLAKSIWIYCIGAWRISIAPQGRIVPRDVISPLRSLSFRHCRWGSRTLWSQNWRCSKHVVVACVVCVRDGRTYGIFPVAAHVEVESDNCEPSAARAQQGVASLESRIKLHRRTFEYSTAAYDRGSEFTHELCGCK